MHVMTNLVAIARVESGSNDPDNPGHSFDGSCISLPQAKLYGYDSIFNR